MVNHKYKYFNRKNAWCFTNEISSAERTEKKIEDSPGVA